MDSGPKYSKSVASDVNCGQVVTPPSGLVTGVGVGLLKYTWTYNMDNDCGKKQQKRELFLVQFPLYLIKYSYSCSLFDKYFHSHFNIHPP